MLNPLPPSTDEFWDGDKYSIDINTIKNLLCKVHKFDLYRDKRELKCNVCGYTGRFTPSTIVIKDNKVIIKGIRHILDNIY